MKKWRVGQHYNIHVYEGETPVCTAMTAVFARQIVDDHNVAAQIAEREREYELAKLALSDDKQFQIRALSYLEPKRAERERAIAEAVRGSALQAAEQAKRGALAHYGVAESVGADMAIRRIRALDLAPILAAEERHK